MAANAFTPRRSLNPCPLKLDNASRGKLTRHTTRPPRLSHPCCCLRPQGARGQHLQPESTATQRWCHHNHHPSARQTDGGVLTSGALTRCLQRLSRAPLAAVVRGTGGGGSATTRASSSGATAAPPAVAELRGEGDRPGNGAPSSRSGALDADMLGQKLPNQRPLRAVCRPPPPRRRAHGLGAAAWRGAWRWCQQQQQGAGLPAYRGRGWKTSRESELWRCVSTRTSDCEWVRCRGVLSCAALSSLVQGKQHRQANKYTVPCLWSTAASGTSTQGLIVGPARLPPVAPGGPMSQGLRAEAYRPSQRTRQSPAA